MADLRFDVTVIGGGILGLATAMKLTQAYPRLRVAVVEKEEGLAAHQTGHNSGVIHSGLYYRPGSQKANFCVSGAHALRNYCEAHAIPYRLVGKLVVATTEAELPALDTLHQRGMANGVEGLEMVGPERLREVEPHVSGIRGLHCPRTGIVDFKEVSRAYAADLTAAGGEILTGTRVLRVVRSDGGMRLVTTRGDIATDRLINCAGLHADFIVRAMGLPSDVRIIPFRGEYYTLVPEKRHLVSGLIYPVPDPRFPFLGVHYTRTIQGGVEAGPNAVLAFAKEGYTKGTINVSELLGILAFGGFWNMGRKHWRTGLREMYRSFSKGAFTRSLQRLIPEIREGDLAPGGAGVRAQAVDRTGFLLDDFSIVETEDAIHVQNAPSPAATASLGIGEHIAGLAATAFDLAGRAG